MTTSKEFKKGLRDVLEICCVLVLFVIASSMTGYLMCVVGDKIDMVVNGEQITVCTTCDGTGEASYHRKCAKCDGSGIVD